MLGLTPPVRFCSLLNDPPPSPPQWTYFLNDSYSIPKSFQQDSNVYDVTVDKISTYSHELKCYMLLWQANRSCKKSKLLHQGRTERKLLH